ncbi:MAG TPA: glycosyltransferase family 2 protein [Candidatus Aquicultor sp.]|jgi:glycosyltransferase involved in cell wall biosynthesis
MMSYKNASDLKLAIIVPAYNEAQVVCQTLSSIPREYAGVSETRIVVIDDGSTDATSTEIRRLDYVVPLRHVINRGLGGALRTGMEWARRWGADIAVTFDADGQLNPNDIQRVIQPLINREADVAIGSRLLEAKDMPWYRIVGNWGLNIITYVLFSVWTTDSQSGLRAFSSKALEAIHLISNRMEVSSEIIAEIGRNKLRIEEIPIDCIYNEYSLSKGQSNSNGINIVLNLFFRKVSP